MPWVRIDDAFYDHAKWIAADPCEIGLWLIGLAWSNRNLKDGRVPKVVLQRAGAREETLDTMVAREILRDGGDCWELVNYLEWQRSAEQIRDTSEKLAEAGRKGGLAKAKAKPPASPPLAEPEHQPKNASTKRHRDELFTALCGVFGPASTKTRQGFYGSMVTELLEVNASGPEVIKRGAALKKKGWKDADARALVKHWDQLATNGNGPNYEDTLR